MHASCPERKGMGGGKGEGARGRGGKNSREGMDATVCQKDEWPHIQVLVVTRVQYARDAWRAGIWI